MENIKATRYKSWRSFTNDFS